mgnify:CR=1 FL=1
MSCNLSNPRSKHFTIDINGKKICYLYIRKNACSAWKELFKGESKHQYDKEKYPNPVSFMGEFHKSDLESNFKYKIMIVREPLGRVVSGYLNQFVLRLERENNLHQSVSEQLGCAPENVTFKDFVHIYLRDVKLSYVDAHFWTQQSHMANVQYEKILLKNLHKSMADIIGKELSDKYFSKKLNSTSNFKKYEVSSDDVDAIELFHKFKKGEGLPTVESFLSPSIKAHLLSQYSKDIELYESVK